MKKSKILKIFLSLAVVFAFILPAAMLSGCNKQPAGKVSIVYVVNGIEAGRKEYDAGTTLTQEQVYEGWQEERQGYQFDGWYFDSNKTRKLEGNFQLNSTTNLYATSVIGRFTITFDTADGTQILPITQNYGSEIMMPSDPVRTGYDFAGWNPAIPETMPDHDITITATWTAHSHTLTFIWGDGENERQTITANFGTQIIAPTPTKEGYTLTDWGEDVPETMPDQDITFNANWTINSHTITFDTDGGSQIDPITQDYGTQVNAPAAPTKDGYDFAGWFNGTEQVNFPITMPDQDLTIVAHWGTNLFTMTFVLDNGQPNIEIRQNQGTAYTAPVPTKLGYTLTGWSPALPETFPGADGTYTAQWQLISYNIRRIYVDQTDEITHYNINQTFTLGEDAHEGYTFDYWSVTTAAGNWTADAHILATDELSGKYGDITITAHNHINQYTITFVLENGQPNIVITQDYGTSITAPQSPTKTGHTFAGWDGTIPSTMPAENLTITATWIVKQNNINVTIADKTVQNWNQAIADQIDAYEEILENPDLNPIMRANIEKIITVLQNAAKTYGYFVFANGELNFGDNDVAIADSYVNELGGTENAVKDAITAAGGIASTFKKFTPNAQTGYQISYNTNISNLYLVFAGAFYRPSRVTLSIGGETIKIPTIEVGTDENLYRVETYMNFSGVCVIRLNLNLPEIIDEGCYIYDGDMTVSVEWEPMKAEVVYHKGNLPNAGEIAGENLPELFEFDTNYTLAESEYEAVGYHVTHWTNEDSNPPTDHSTGSAFSAAQSLELYIDEYEFVAKWAANENPLSFDANDSDNTDYPATMPSYSAAATYNSALSAITNVPTRTGYTFLGFFTDDNIKIFNADGSVNVPESNNAYLSTTGAWIYGVAENNEEVELFAHWQGNEYTITYDATEGGVFNPQDSTSRYRSFTLRCGDTITTAQIPTPAKAGLVFKGWVPSIPQKMPAQNLTFTATWKSYSVTLSVNNTDAGAFTVDSLHQDVTAYESEVNVDALFTVTITTIKDAYQFDGWYEGATKLGENLTLSFTMTPMNRTIEAKFSVKSELALFEFNDSTPGEFVILGIKSSVDKSTITSIVVPSYVTEIAEGAFKGCPNLVSLDIPFIGKSADTSKFENEDFDGLWFYSLRVTVDEYNALKKSTIYNIQYLTKSSVTTYYAFPKTLTTLCIHATYGVDEHDEPKPLSIPNNAFWVGAGAQDNMPVTTIYFDGTMEDYLGLSFGAGTASPMFCSGTVNFYVKDNGEYVSTAGTLSIPEGTTTITQYKFLGWTHITKLVLPTGLKKIGKQAFKGCNNLQTLIINETSYPNSSNHGIVGDVFNDCYVADHGKINVYFAGDQATWVALTNSNASSTYRIKDATLRASDKVNVYFYSETEPTAADYTTDEIRFWHYVNNEPVVWIKPTQS